MCAAGAPHARKPLHWQPALCYHSLMRFPDLLQNVEMMQADVRLIWEAVASLLHEDVRAEYESMLHLVQSTETEDF